MFTHEKFKAYQLAIQYWKQTITLLEQLPSGNAALKEQLKRAAASISLNIAEGTGRVNSKDRKRFYSIARGSVLECAAITDLIREIDPSLEGEVLDSKERLRSIANILSSVLLR